MGKKLTTEEFIKRAREVHGDKYDYSKVIYVNSYAKVCIICPEHGEFWQNPRGHLSGQGCPLCAKESRYLIRQKDKAYFVEKARKKHGDRYDYSKVVYTKAKNKVLIICPEHGEFWQTASMHLQGNGCPKCGIIKYSNLNRKSTEAFIEESKRKWGDKYDYSKVKYENAHKKVCIICPKHGEFWQEPDNHLRWGCKSCSESSLETHVKDMLDKHCIHYKKKKKFKWLKNKGNLSLDFYLADINVAVECQGEQHFETYRFEADNSRLNKRKTRDEAKKKLCEQNGIKIIYYCESSKYDEFLGEKMVKTIDELYNKIKEYGNYK